MPTLGTLLSTNNDAAAQELIKKAAVFDGKDEEKQAYQTKIKERADRFLRILSDKLKETRNEANITNVVLTGKPIAENELPSLKADTDFQKLYIAAISIAVALENKAPTPLDEPIEKLAALFDPSELATPNLKEIIRHTAVGSTQESKELKTASAIVSTPTPATAEVKRVVAENKSAAPPVRENYIISFLRENKTAAPSAEQSAVFAKFTFKNEEIFKVIKPGIASKKRKIGEADFKFSGIAQLKTYMEAKFPPLKIVSPADKELFYRLLVENELKDLISENSPIKNKNLRNLIRDNFQHIAQKLVTNAMSSMAVTGVKLHKDLFAALNELQNSEKLNRKKTLEFIAELGVSVKRDKEKKYEAKYSLDAKNLAGRILAENLLIHFYDRLNLNTSKGLQIKVFLDENWEEVISNFGTVATGITSAFNTFQKNLDNLDFIAAYAQIKPAVATRSSPPPSPDRANVEKKSSSPISSRILDEVKTINRVLVEIQTTEKSFQEGLNLLEQQKRLQIAGLKYAEEKKTTTAAKVFAEFVSEPYTSLAKTSNPIFLERPGAEAKENSLASLIENIEDPAKELSLDPQFNLVLTRMLNVAVASNVLQTNPELHHYLTNPYVRNPDTQLSTPMYKRPLDEYHKARGTWKSGTSDILITPVQRVPRYELLLKEIINRTNKTIIELTKAGFTKQAAAYQAKLIHLEAHLESVKQFATKINEATRTPLKSACEAFYVFLAQKHKHEIKMGAESSPENLLKLYEKISAPPIEDKKKSDPELLENIKYFLQSVFKTDDLLKIRNILHNEQLIAATIISLTAVQPTDNPDVTSGKEKLKAQINRVLPALTKIGRASVKLDAKDIAAATRDLRDRFIATLKEVHTISEEDQKALANAKPGAKLSDADAKKYEQLKRTIRTNIANLSILKKPADEKAISELISEQQKVIRELTTDAGTGQTLEFAFVSLQKYRPPSRDLYSIFPDHKAELDAIMGAVTKVKALPHDLDTIVDFMSRGAGGHPIIRTLAQDAYGLSSEEIQSVVTDFNAIPSDQLNILFPRVSTISFADATLKFKAAPKKSAEAKTKTQEPQVDTPELTEVDEDAEVIEPTDAKNLDDLLYDSDEEVVPPSEEPPKPGTLNATVKDVREPTPDEAEPLSIPLEAAPRPAEDTKSTAVGELKAKAPSLEEDAEPEKNEKDMELSDVDDEEDVNKFGTPSSKDTTKSSAAPRPAGGTWVTGPVIEPQPVSAEPASPSAEPEPRPAEDPESIEISPAIVSDIEGQHRDGSAGPPVFSGESGTAVPVQPFTHPLTESTIGGPKRREKGPMQRPPASASGSADNKTDEVASPPKSPSDPAVAAGSVAPVDEKAKRPAVPNHAPPPKPNTAPPSSADTTVQEKKGNARPKEIKLGIPEGTVGDIYNALVPKLGLSEAKAKEQLLAFLKNNVDNLEPLLKNSTLPEVVSLLKSSFEKPRENEYKEQNDINEALKNILPATAKSRAKGFAQQIYTSDFTKMLFAKKKIGEFFLAPSISRLQSTGSLIHLIRTKLGNTELLSKFLDGLHKGSSSDSHKDAKALLITAGGKRSDGQDNISGDEAEAFVTEWNKVYSGLSIGKEILNLAVDDFINGEGGKKLEEAAKAATDKELKDTAALREQAEAEAKKRAEAEAAAAAEAEAAKKLAEEKAKAAALVELNQAADAVLGNFDISGGNSGAPLGKLKGKLTSDIRGFTSGQISGVASAISTFAANPDLSKVTPSNAEEAIALRFVSDAKKRMDKIATEALIQAHKAVVKAYESKFQAAELEEALQVTENNFPATHFFGKVKSLSPSDKMMIARAAMKSADLNAKIQQPEVKELAQAGSILTALYKPLEDAFLSAQNDAKAKAKPALVVALTSKAPSLPELSDGDDQRLKDIAREYVLGLNGEARETANKIVVLPSITFANINRLVGPKVLPSFTLDTPDPPEVKTFADANTPLNNFYTAAHTLMTRAMLGLAEVRNAIAGEQELKAKQDEAKRKEEARKKEEEARKKQEEERKRREEDERKAKEAKEADDALLKAAQAVINHHNGKLKLPEAKLDELKDLIGRYDTGLVSDLSALSAEEKFAIAKAMTTDPIGQAPPDVKLGQGAAEVKKFYSGVIEEVNQVLIKATQDKLGSAAIAIVNEYKSLIPVSVPEGERPSDEELKRIIGDFQTAESKIVLATDNMVAFLRTSGDDSRSDDIINLGLREPLQSFEHQLETAIAPAAISALNSAVKSMASEDKEVISGLTTIAELKDAKVTAADFKAAEDALIRSLGILKASEKLKVLTAITGNVAINAKSIEDTHVGETNTAIQTFKTKIAELKRKLEEENAKAQRRLKALAKIEEQLERNITAYKAKMKLHPEAKSKGAEILAIEGKLEELKRQFMKTAEAKNYSDDDVQAFLSKPLPLTPQFLGLDFNADFIIPAMGAMEAYAKSAIVHYAKAYAVQYTTQINDELKGRGQPQLTSHDMQKLNNIGIQLAESKLNAMHKLDVAIYIANKPAVHAVPDKTPGKTELDTYYRSLTAFKADITAREEAYKTLQAYMQLHADWRKEFLDLPDVKTMHLVAPGSPRADIDHKLDDSVIAFIAKIREIKPPLDSEGISELLRKIKSEEIKDGDPGFAAYDQLLVEMDSALVPAANAALKHVVQSRASGLVSGAALPTEHPLKLAETVFLEELKRIEIDPKTMMRLLAGINAGEFKESYEQLVDRSQRTPAWFKRDRTDFEAVKAALLKFNSAVRLASFGITPATLDTAPPLPTVKLKISVAGITRQIAESRKQLIRMRAMYYGQGARAIPLTELNGHIVAINNHLNKPLHTACHDQIEKELGKIHQALGKFTEAKGLESKGDEAKAFLSAVDDSKFNSDPKDLTSLNTVLDNLRDKLKIPPLSEDKAKKENEEIIAAIAAISVLRKLQNEIAELEKNGTRLQKTIKATTQPDSLYCLPSQTPERPQIFERKTGQSIEQAMRDNKALDPGGPAASGSGGIVSSTVSDVPRFIQDNWTRGIDRDHFRVNTVDRLLPNGTRDDKNQYQIKFVEFLDTSGPIATFSSELSHAPDALHPEKLWARGVKPENDIITILLQAKGLTKAEAAAKLVENGYDPAEANAMLTPEAETKITTPSGGEETITRAKKVKFLLEEKLISAREVKWFNTHGERYQKSHEYLEKRFKGKSDDDIALFLEIIAKGVNRERKDPTDPKAIAEFLATGFKQHKEHYLQYLAQDAIRNGANSTDAGQIAQQKMEAIESMMPNAMTRGGRDYFPSGMADALANHFKAAAELPANKDLMRETALMFINSYLVINPETKQVVINKMMTPQMAKEIMAVVELLNFFRSKNDKITVIDDYFGVDPAAIRQELWAEAGICVDRKTNKLDIVLDNDDCLAGRLRRAATTPDYSVVVSEAKETKGGMAPPLPPLEPGQLRVELKESKSAPPELHYEVLSPDGKPVQGVITAAELETKGMKDLKNPLEDKLSGALEKEIINFVVQKGDIPRPDPLARLFTAHIAGDKDFAFQAIGNALKDGNTEQQEEFKRQQGRHDKAIQKAKMQRVTPFTKFNEGDRAKHISDMGKEEEYKIKPR